MSVSTQIRQFIRSNLIGIVALFVALGGTAYATHPGGADTISSGDLIDQQVRTQDLRDEAVTGPKLGPSSVGSPKVANGSLTGVDVANQSLTATDIQLSCPTGMTRFGSTLCIDTAPRGEVTDHRTALTRCADAGLRLPSESEAWLARAFAAVDGDAFWTDLAYREATADPEANVAMVLENGPSALPHRLRVHAVSAPIPVRCATVPRG